MLSETVSVSRFDGDVSSVEREDELERFKADKDCRVLLMTVQTGGTGTSYFALLN